MTNNLLKQVNIKHTHALSNKRMTNTVERTILVKLIGREIYLINNSSGALNLEQKKAPFN